MSTEDTSLLKTAEFDTGAQVTKKMVNLANNSIYFWDDTIVVEEGTDEAIQAIKRGNTLPSGFVPSTDNTVSVSTSPYPIYIWWDSSTNTIYYYSEASVLYLNSSSNLMFYHMRSLTDIRGLSELNTSRMVLMSGMFEYSEHLTNISPLSNWDTSHVTHMGGLFAFCSSLESIDAISNWDTSSVTSISYIFRNCPKMSGTIQILGNPTEYTNVFRNTATASGAQITVKYGSSTSNIDAIIATKTSDSNVVKGTQVSAPASSNDVTFSHKTLSFDGSETVSNSYTASKSGTIDLSNIGLSFTEPGVYDLTVKETATSNPAYPTTSTEYTITIQVASAVGANNEITGNFTAAFVVKDSNDNKVNTMSFAHPKDESYFGHIELTKTVKGLMAQTSKYFDFTVQVDNATGGTCSNYTGSEKYPVSGGDASHVTISEVTKCKSGTKDSLSLKNGQTAKIGQFTYNNVNYNSISIDDYYKIVEANESDYVTTFKIGSGSETSGRDTSSQSVSAGTNSVNFYNTKSGSPLTGVALTIMPFLIIIGIGTGGVILFRKKKNKKEEIEVI